jgi:hypothetical protein
LRTKIAKLEPELQRLWDALHLYGPAPRSVFDEYNKLLDKKRILKSKIEFFENELNILRLDDLNLRILLQKQRLQQLEQKLHSAVPRLDALDANHNQDQENLFKAKARTLFKRKEELFHEYFIRNEYLNQQLRKISSDIEKYPDLAQDPFIITKKAHFEQQRSDNYRDMICL